MRLQIETPEELGLVLRLVRKTQRVRADDMASSAGVGPVFVMDVERGKPTVQLGKVMQLLKEAGIELVVELPQDIAEQAKRSASKGANSARVQSLLSAMFSRRSNKA